MLPRCLSPLYPPIPQRQKSDRPVAWSGRSTTGHGVPPWPHQRSAWPGLLILACLVVFSLARGLCRFASKGLWIGKTVPKTRRGAHEMACRSPLSGWLATGFRACMPDLAAG